MDQRDPAPFRTTAVYYARYRPGCPGALLARLRDAFALDGRGRMLDLGCGPGQLAISMTLSFDEVFAMDPEPEMISEGRAAAAREGAVNIRWAVAGSENLSATLGRFRLVTIGNAFHWMDREKVLALLFEIVTEDGGVALINCDAPVWGGKEAWQRSAVEVIQRHLGERRRGGHGSISPPGERHEVVISRSRFKRITEEAFKFERELSIDAIVGLLYSTSFCSRRVLGDRAPAFERDLRRALSELKPDGKFVERGEFQLLLGWKR